MIKKTVRLIKDKPAPGDRKSVIEYRICGILIYKKELFHPLGEGDDIYYDF